MVCNTDSSSCVTAVLSNSVLNKTSTATPTTLERKQKLNCSCLVCRWKKTPAFACALYPLPLPRLRNQKATCLSTLFPSQDISLLTWVLHLGVFVREVRVWNGMCSCSRASQLTAVSVYRVQSVRYTVVPVQVHTHVLFAC